MITLGYYPGWVQRALPPERLPWDALTHIAHFGRYPNPDGTVAVADMQAEAQHGPLVTAARNAGRTPILTLGGGGTWAGRTIGASFAAACSTLAGRARLAANTAALTTRHGYAGVGLDWEEGVPAHADAWVGLLAELRTALPPGALLTAAVVSGLVPAPVAARAAGLVDWFDVMSYWTDGADEITHYRAGGIPPGKLVVGAGFSAGPTFADGTAAAVRAKVAVARAAGAAGVMFWQTGDLTPGPTTDPRLQPLREATAMPLDPRRLPDILRAAGLAVGVVPDFTSNGHGTLNPGGHLLHHTAGHGLRAVYAWPGRWTDGRPDVPSPRCNLWWPRDRTAGEGVDVWCVTSGMAYHAGAGSSVALDDILAGRMGPGVADAAARGLIDEPGTPGNGRLIGHEVDNLGTPDDPYPDGQLTNLARGIRAINAAAGWRPGHAGHHRQYTRRKPDMSYRGDIWARIAAPAKEDDMPLTPAELALLNRAVTAAESANALIVRTRGVTLPNISTTIAAVTARLDALAKVVGDDEKTILGALAALHIELDDAQVSALASAIHIDYAQVAAAVRADIHAATVPGV